MDKEFRKLNLHHTSHKEERKKHSHYRGVKPLIGLIIVIVLIGFIWNFFHSDSSVVRNVFSTVNPIESTDGRVNILLLGNAGGRHDGATLTDSIIVASYNLESNRVTMFSIPRDLWVDTARAKVNTIYQNGLKNDGDGLKYAEDKIDDILGIPIHYGVRIDFNGFSKAVDIIGGVDVEVAKTFDDYLYPIEGKENDLCGLEEKELELNEEEAKKFNLKPGKQKLLIDPKLSGSDDKQKIATDSASFACRFEHIHFDKGYSQMNGTTALKYVRSRMGTNGEGSDFARSRRQQLVIQAFRSKVLSLNTLTDPSKVGGLISTLGSSFETDIPIDKFVNFYDLLKKADNMEAVVLGDLGKGESLFITPPPSDYGGAWTLIPPDRNYAHVHEFVQQKLNPVESTPSASPAASAR